MATRPRRSVSSRAGSSAITTTTVAVDGQQLEDVSNNDMSARNDNLPDGQNAIKSLSQRLASFRKWLAKEANVTLHPSVYIVNGEATDGTKNAPVLLVEGNDQKSVKRNPGERLGVANEAGDQSLYEENMGCEVRAVREIREGELLFSIPRSAMLTPDLVAASDAGRAVRMCCATTSEDDKSFWGVFENTTVLQNSFETQITGRNGAQLLVKVLSERKRVENLNKVKIESTESGNGNEVKLAEPKSVSTRAPLLAFLIHQRFSDYDKNSIIRNESANMPSSLRHTTHNTGNNDDSVQLVENCPKTFAPYAHTLPSIVPVPLCWQRNELALLSSCLPGVPILQDVTTNTMLLASEFIQLVNAGILERFPDVFPPGLLTWDRWVWAAAVHASRALPVTCYLNEGDSDASSFKPANALEFQSPSDVWQELGVMVPLLDMLNHEADLHQVTWKPTPAVGHTASPFAVTHKKIKKDEQLFCCYGMYDNTRLLQQYGFTQLNNSYDEVKVGWSLSDAVGNVSAPELFDNPVMSDGRIFESSDAEKIDSWWTTNRLKLLEREAFAGVDNNFMESLKAGKQMTSNVYNNGTYCPILLTVSVVATMPVDQVDVFLGDSKENILKISKKHQQLIRAYLAHYYTKKLRKLLQMISSGLASHIPHASFNTDVKNLFENGNSLTNDKPLWDFFFETAVRKETIQVEENFYTMGTEACVLSLCNGNIRALESSIKSLLDDDQFSTKVCKQLQDIGYSLSIADDGYDDQKEVNVKMESVEESFVESKVAKTNDSRSPRAKKRNRSRSSGDNSLRRTSVIKLHVGNLAYTTRASDLYDFFTSKYGRENVLDCHIPIEKETGRSRGFGFVTMPEKTALEIVNSSSRHEIHGRMLKIARSSSSGATPPINVDFCNGPPVRDRCRTCGYSPRYCTCPNKGQPISIPTREVPQQNKSSLDRDLSSHDRNLPPHDRIIPPYEPLPRDLEIPARDLALPPRDLEPPPRDLIHPPRELASHDRLTRDIPPRDLPFRDVQPRDSSREFRGNRRGYENELDKSRNNHSQRPLNGHDGLDRYDNFGMSSSNRHSINGHDPDRRNYASRDRNEYDYDRYGVRIDTRDSSTMGGKAQSSRHYDGPFSGDDRYHDREYHDELDMRNQSGKRSRHRYRRSRSRSYSRSNIRHSSSPESLDGYRNNDGRSRRDHHHSSSRSDRKRNNSRSRHESRHNSSRSRTEYKRSRSRSRSPSATHSRSRSKRRHSSRRRRSRDESRSRSRSGDEPPTAGL